MKGIKVLSLFDGISCGQAALERAGIPVETYYASEINRFAIQITQKNYPNTKQLGDVRDIVFKELHNIDLLMGGSPCQDLSIAKQNRKGLEGERSGLFFKFVEALKTIQPKYFLFENVASMRQSDRDIISNILGVEPIMINSASVSAQQRKRLYWTNIPNVTQPDDRGILLCDILESGLSTNDKAYALTGIYEKHSFPHDFIKHKKSTVFTPVREGTCANTKGGQASRIYSVHGKSITLSANGGGGGAKTGLYKIKLPDGDYTIRKLTPIECERLQTLPDNYTAGISNTQRYKTLGNGWTVDIIAHILKNIK